MGNFSVIADTSKAILTLLREELRTDVGLSPESIGLCAPSDKGDVVLGIHLYDIWENREVRGRQMINEGPSAQRYPSLYLNLAYMITAYSKAEIQYRAMENHRILGKVIQVLQDHSTLSPEYFGGSDRDLDLHLEMLNPNMEERRKIWNVANEAYQTSIFYQVGPVVLESQKTRNIQRVVATDTGMRG